MNRRELMAVFGAASVGLLLPGRTLAQGRPPVAIKAREGSLGLRAGGPETPIWMLASPELRFRRGDHLQVEFANDLKVPVGLDWRGIDGVAAQTGSAGAFALAIWSALPRGDPARFPDSRAGRPAETWRGRVPTSRKEPTCVRCAPYLFSAPRC